MQILGRALQITALITLPLSMILELSGALGRRFGVSDMVVMLGYGIVAFLLGRALESRTQM
ncbi:MAG TPA: hypothetical protein PLV92_09775 [Pirellulaceae bacterium]|nr:hypothetical protein [Pirellulaceae bacterium]